MQVELAFEHDGHDILGAARLLVASHNHFIQSLAMVVVQLVNAPVQAGERLAMSGQGQGVAIEGFELVDGIQKLPQRIRLRLVLMYAHIGGDAWQHHVPANQNPQLGAVKCNVFGGMAVAADATPALVTNSYHVAILHTFKTSGDSRHQVGEVTCSGLDLRQVVDVLQSVGLKECGGVFTAAEPRRRQGRDSRNAVVGGANPQAANVLWRCP